MNALHFDSLVWHWPIAIYLFLAGVSAGAMFFAVLLKHVCLKEQAYRSGFVQAACIVAAVSVLAGLGILVLDLTKPWDFWKILVFYNPTSVMSMGVLILLIYQVFMYAWIAVVFRKPIEEWCQLPLLFLASGLSSGAAASLLGGVLLKGSPNGQEVRFIHRVEIPLILGEIFLIFTFFMGLVLSGGQSKVAALNAIGEGFWGLIFWFGIMGLGLSAPLAMNLFMNATSKRKFSYVAGTACLSLLGVIMLRNFVLYTGQMVVS